MFRHVLYTWLLANFIYPAVIILYFIMGESGVNSPTQFFAGYLYFLWISLVLSLPCLLISWLCFSVISRSQNSVDVKFTLWLLVGPSLAFCECISLVALVPGIGNEKPLLTISAIIAVVLAIVIRHRHFNYYFEPLIKLEV